MPTPPKMSDEQRAAALAKAAQVRRERSELKTLLKSGSLSLTDVLQRAENDSVVGGMKVSAVIAALPGIGRVKAARTMEDLDIAENRRLRGLGDRQRQALLDNFS